MFNNKKAALPLLILGFPALWFITIVILAILVILLFFFSTTFKIMIMFLGIYIIYKYLPPNWKKLSNLEFSVLLSFIFLIVMFVGKGTGFLSVASPTIQEKLQNFVLSPVNLALIFLSAVLGLMYFHRRRK